MTIDRAPYHVGIATPDLEESMRALGALFECGWTSVHSGRDFQLSGPDGGVDDTARRTFSTLGTPRIELLEGSPGSVWAPERGLHLHHTAYWSDDVAGDCARMLSEGWVIERTTFDEEQRPKAFVYLVREGQWIEFVDIDRRAEHLRLFDQSAAGELDSNQEGLHAGS